MKSKYKMNHTIDKMNIVSIIAILATSLLHMPLSFVFVTIMLEFNILNYINNHRKINENYPTLKVNHSVKILTFCIILFFLTQGLILQFNFDKILDSFITYSVLFIGIPIFALLSRTLRNFEVYIAGLTSFIVIFSSYYLALVLLKGLPNDRDSILGFVSSNYIAAIIYISYPVIFYYLFGRKTSDRYTYKNNLIKCYLALALSLVVIIISGSRSAFGAIGLEIVALLLLKKKKFNDTIKFSIILSIILGFIYVLYMSFPEVYELITRAMNALNGRDEVKNDIRFVVWNQAMIDFKQMNQFLGSGSVIVQAYVRPPHNIFLEVLLFSGYVGVSLYVLYIFFLLKYTLKNKNGYQKYFIFLILAVSCLIGYVQPFFSTGYTCGIIMWTSIISIASDNKKRVRE